MASVTPFFVESQNMKLRTSIVVSSWLRRLTQVRPAGARRKPVRDSSPAPAGSERQRAAWRHHPASAGVRNDTSASACLARNDRDRALLIDGPYFLCSSFTSAVTRSAPRCTVTRTTSAGLWVRRALVTSSRLLISLPAI